MMDGIKFEYTTKDDEQGAKGRITYAFKAKKVDGPDDGMFRFEGMASTFNNVDLEGDIIEPGAFTASLQRLEARRDQDGGLMPVLFSHSPSAPIGVFTSLTETDDGLFAKGELPLDDTFVAGRIVPQMRRGSIRAMSIGFQILDRRFEGDLRVIERIELFEASLVVFPANPLARVTSIGKNNNVDGINISRLSSDDLEYLQTRELEDMFMSGFPLSRKLAMKVVALLVADQRDAETTQDAPRDAAAKDTHGLSIWHGMADGLLAATKGSSSRGFGNC